MKKSELKKLISEVVREELKVILPKVLKEFKAAPQIDRASLRAKLKLDETSEYDNIPAPKVEAEILDSGEKYVSGKNILDWYAQSKGAKIQEQTKQSTQSSRAMIKKLGLDK